ETSFSTQSVTFTSTAVTLPSFIEEIGQVWGPRLERLEVYFSTPRNGSISPPWPLVVRVRDRLDAPGVEQAFPLLGRRVFGVRILVPPFGPAPDGASLIIGLPRGDKPP